MILPAFGKVAHCFPLVFFGIIFQNIIHVFFTAPSTFNYECIKYFWKILYTLITCHYKLPIVSYSSYPSCF